jgi:hypothetical protein
MATKFKGEYNLFALTGQEDGFDYHGWYNLPECVQEDNEAPYVLIVDIDTKENLDKFADIIDQPNLKNDSKLNTKSIWYPKLVMGERGSNTAYMWIDENSVKFGDAV